MLMTVLFNLLIMVRSSEFFFRKVKSLDYCQFSDEIKREVANDPYSNQGSNERLLQLSAKPFSKSLDRL